MRKCFFIMVMFIFAASLNANSLSDIYIYDSGVYPRGITVGDFSGDSKSEILVANFGEDTLIGQENDNEPTSSLSLFDYQGGTDFGKNRISAGSSPRGLHAGDIDGNGNNDFVVTNYMDGNVMIFIRDENGNVSQETVAVGRYPVGAAIGAIDNESIKKSDIAVAVYSDSVIAVLTRDSKGEWTKETVAVPGNPTDVVIGKINGERIIVSANYTAGSISIIKKQGNDLVKTLDAKSGGGVCKVEIADVTGDGVEDIIAANFHDNTIAVFEYKNGVLTEPVIYKLAGSRPNGMAAGDVNGDGRIDVVTANRDSDTVDVFLQQSDGTLKLSKTYAVTEDEVKTYGPVEVIVADVNGDGMSDIAFTHMRTGTLRVIFQELPKAPKISSSTHPDESVWYGDNSPLIHFESGDEFGTKAAFNYTVSKEDVPFDVSKSEVTTTGDVKLENLETGTWIVKAVSKDSTGNISEVSVFKINITAEMNEKTVYNFPNPAKTETTIRFPLDTPKEVKIVVIDSKGTMVWHKELSAGDVVSGINYVKWDLMNDVGMSIANGVYICKIIAGDKVVVKKIAVVK